MELLNLIKRELRIIFGSVSDILNVIVFFVITCFAFSFALSGQVDLKTAASIILVCFMLAANLSSRFIFERDMESGVLQQLFLSLRSLNNLVFAKTLSQFIAFGIPLSASVLVASIFFNIPLEKVFLIIKMMIPTAFLLSIIAVMISGITAGIKSGNIISIILSLPLYIPVIVLNLSNVSDERIEQFIYSDYLTSILGMVLIALPLCIFSVRQTIRNAVS